MIIFMEYCSHGTIEEAARQGLPEVVIRRYTKDIVTAVDFLHEHNVVHRDIKGISTLCYSESHTSPVHVACAHRDIKGISTLCYSESHTSPVHVACAHCDIKGISTLCYSESHTSPVHVACAAIHFLHETYVTVTVANRKLVQNVPSSGNWAQ